MLQKLFHLDVIPFYLEKTAPTTDHSHQTLATDWSHPFLSSSSLSITISLSLALIHALSLHHLCISLSLSHTHTLTHLRYWHQLCFISVKVAKDRSSRTNSTFSSVFFSIFFNLFYWCNEKKVKILIISKSKDHFRWAGDQFFATGPMLIITANIN